MWRAETAFDEGRYEDACEHYEKVLNAFADSGKAKPTFDLNLKLAMSAHNAGNEHKALEEYERARMGILASDSLKEDNRQYLLAFIDYYTRALGVPSKAGTSHVFDAKKVRKRWKSEFPLPIE